MSIFKRKLKRYAIYSVNHDTLMQEDFEVLVFVYARDERDMYKKLESMAPAKSTEFLIFEQV